MRKRLAALITVPVNWLDRVWQSAGWFGYRGTRFIHVGIHVDQPTCCKVLDFVYRRLVDDHGINSEIARETLSKTWVFFRPGAFSYEGGEYSGHSRWYDGFLKHGVAEIAYVENWPQALATALFNLAIGRAMPEIEQRRRSHAATSSAGKHDRPAERDPGLGVNARPEMEIPGG